MRRSSTRGFYYSLAGAAALVVLIFLLPLIDVSQKPALIVWITSYVLAIVPVALLLHGAIVASSSYATSRLLALGAVSAVLGFLAALIAHPENLGEGSGFLVLLTLCVADLGRILAAALVGVSLARYVTSVGTVLIIVVAAIAADVFSVFAGPTEALVREGSPLLDFLLLIFPTFGSPLGFALGLSDFIFLALFAATSRFLDLRYAATLLAVTAGLLLERPLPALPFIAIAFLLVNVDLIPGRLITRS
jgi:hypothetical protein